jgi:hypothetical protein
MAREFVSVAHLDEAALQDAVAQAPVAALVSASHPVFQFYSSGVFDHPLTSDCALNHVVLIVGYGTSDAGIAYWKVRNSWGERWGLGGYMLLRRNVNMAGIASYGSYPTKMTVPPPKPAIKAENYTRETDRIRGADSVPQPTVYDGVCHKPQEGDLKLDSYPSGHPLMYYDGEVRADAIAAAAPFSSPVCEPERATARSLTVFSFPTLRPTHAVAHCLRGELGREVRQLRDRRLQDARLSARGISGALRARARCFLSTRRALACAHLSATSTFASCSILRAGWHDGVGIVSDGIVAALHGLGDVANGLQIRPHVQEPGLLDVSQPRRELRLLRGRRAEQLHVQLRLHGSRCARCQRLKGKSRGAQPRRHAHDGSRVRRRAAKRPDV